MLGTYAIICLIGKRNTLLSQCGNIARCFTFSIYFIIFDTLYFYLSGIFYQNVKADRSKCQNPVSYLKLTEFTADGKAIEKEQVHLLFTNIYIIT